LESSSFTGIVSSLLSSAAEAEDADVEIAAAEDGEAASCSCLTSCLLLVGNVLE